MNTEKLNELKERAARAVQILIRRKEAELSELLGEGQSPTIIQVVSPPFQPPPSEPPIFQRPFTNDQPAEPCGTIWCGGSSDVEVRMREGAA